MTKDTKPERRYNPDDLTEDPDAPYKYSTSEAYVHRSIDTFAPKPKYVPPAYQAPIVVVSLVSFLVYFGILREENDLDEIIYARNPMVDKFVAESKTPEQLLQEAMKKKEEEIEAKRAKLARK